MSFADYYSIKAVNWSTLRAMRVSPLAYKDILATPVTETPAMVFGRAVHCAVLEPDRFPRDFLLWDGRRGTNDYKAFVLAAQDKTILGADDYERVLAVRDAVHRHPQARRYLRWGKPEVTLTWRDALTGLPCKARLDKLSRNWWLEFKTTRTLDAHDWGNRIAYMAYHGQLGFYSMGLEGLLWVPAVVIAAESEPPFDVGVFPVPPDVLDEGVDLARELLDRVAQCRKSRRWPGRYPDATPLPFPAWARTGDGAGDYDSLKIEVLAR